jgi:hypothetical protein
LCSFITVGCMRYQPIGIAASDQSAKLHFRAQPYVRLCRISYWKRFHNST